MRTSVGRRSLSAILGGVTVILVLEVAPQPANGGACIDYGDYLHVAGSIELPSSAAAMAVSGFYAYVTGDSLRVVDISNPLSPRIVGSVDTSVSSAVAVDGDYAYVAGPAGLQVVDISIPKSPAVVGVASLSLPAWGIALSGGYAWVVGYQSNVGGFLVVDVSDPTAPVQVAGIDPGGRPRKVAVSAGGTHAYVSSDAIFDYTIAVVDITTPTSPLVLEEIYELYSSNDVVVQGPYAYVLGAYKFSGGTLLIFDISNPGSPVVLGHSIAPLMSYPRRLAVDGSYAYATDLLTGIYSFDVSNSNTPVVVGNAGVGLRAVAAQGPYAYASGDETFQVFDVSNAASPPLIGAVDTPGLAQCVATAGSHAYVADGERGLQVIDISNPSSPVIVGNASTRREAHGVVVTGALACVAAADWLEVIDVSNPSAPLLLATADTPGRAQGVAVSGTYAYVADGNAGLQVIDVSSPGSPVRVGGYVTGGPARGVAVSGTHVYLAAGYGGLYALDVSDPDAPVRTARFELGEYARGVAVQGTSLYVADGDCGDYECYGSGLLVFDITDSAVPVFVGSVNYQTWGGPAMAVAVQGEHAFVAARSSGLQIFPAQCLPPTPVEISDFAAVAGGGAVQLTWRSALESDVVGFHIHRSPESEGKYARLTPEPIRPPAPCVFLDTLVEPGTTYFYRLEAIAASGTSDFFGPASATVEASVRPGIALAQNHPNPFPSSSLTTEIRFVLTRREASSLRIFDGSGRLVRELVNERLDPGSHTAVWDGRNERGAAVGSGVYFYSLEAGELSETRRIARIR